MHGRQVPTLLATPPSNSNLPLRPYHPKHTQSTSSSSSTNPESAFSALLLPSARPSVDSNRSSGEYTAATIFSMYSDNRQSILGGVEKENDDLSSGLASDARLSYTSPSPPPRQSSSRGTSSYQDESGHLSVGTSTAGYTAGKHALRTSMLDYHRPTSSRPTSRLTPRLSDSPEQYSTPLPPPTLETAVQPATPVSAPPSPPFNATRTVDPGQRTSRSPSPKLHLLPVPDRLSVSRPASAASDQDYETPLPSPSTSASYRTPSVSPSGVPSDNGDGGEDVDSFYVRSTYARLEQSGVPGDGYEEGVERTRARAPAKAQKRATVFNEKLGELSTQEIEMLSSLDRYGFKPPKMSSHQENRLALIPLAPLKTDLRPIKTPPLSPPAPANDVRDIPPPSAIGPKETKRIDKWGKMMKVAQRDKGGNIERWTFDEKMKRKASSLAISLPQMRDSLT
ncbi:hypothetical protein FS837_010837 [Tulasnella sp. UAMH 9824]|nr:hypothetical protein FS837_010837 [Tulasnella sp. UAMH 9824]